MRYFEGEGGSVGVLNQTPPARRRIEPRSWARKYLVEASISSFEEDWFIRGTNANIFNSRPAYILIQFVADRARREPRAIMSKKEKWGHLRSDI
jgi:hypothetical protein